MNDWIVEKGKDLFYHVLMLSLKRFRESCAIVMMIWKRIHFSKGIIAFIDRFRYPIFDNCASCCTNEQLGTITWPILSILHTREKLKVDRENIAFS